jgi:hypothetical protein
MLSLSRLRIELSGTRRCGHCAELWIDRVRYGARPQALPCSAELTSDAQVEW